MLFRSLSDSVRAVPCELFWTEPCFWSDQWMSQDPKAHAPTLCSQVIDE